MIKMNQPGKDHNEIVIESIMSIFAKLFTIRPIRRAFKNMEQISKDADPEQILDAVKAAADLAKKNLEDAQLLFPDGEYISPQVKAALKKRHFPDQA